MGDLILRLRRMCRGGCREADKRMKDWNQGVVGEGGGGTKEQGGRGNLIDLGRQVC
jgi:hypothetical protein